jgi:signal recognition particle subunit SEC65
MDDKKSKKEDLKRLKLERETSKRKKIDDSLKLKSRLIDFVRDNPVLWNTKLETYKLKNKDRIWSKFIQDEELTVEEIKSIWKSLRTSYSVARNKPKPSGSSGTRKNEFAFGNAMSF